MIYNLKFLFQVPMLNGVKREIICCCCKITHGPILQIRKRMNKFSNLSCAYCPKLCTWGNTNWDQIIIWKVSSMQLHANYIRILGGGICCCCFSNQSIDLYKVKLAFHQEIKLVHVHKRTSRQIWIWRENIPEYVSRYFAITVTACFHGIMRSDQSPSLCLWRNDTQ